MSKPRARETTAEALQRDVDALIDKYETPGVRSGGSSIPVNAQKDELAFAVEAPDGRLHYRGRILVPVARKKQPKLQQVRLDE